MEIRRVRAGCVAALALLGCACSATIAFSQNGDDDDDATSAASSYPNVYLDLRTIYTAVPPNTLAFGLGGGLASPSLQVSSASSQSIGFDYPLTVDVNDRLSLYGGVSALTSRSGSAPWTPLTVDTWNFGVQFDLYQQNNGPFPTVTVQSTLTRTFDQGPLGTTSTLDIVELDYALNEDETRGLLAGTRINTVSANSALVKVSPAVVGYLGAYYQWPSNWKLTGRAGIQTFGGAQLTNAIRLQSFTQPMVRFDLDKMDDNDNRLFGLTAEIDWTPKPLFQFTLRTPIYADRH